MFLCRVSLLPHTSVLVSVVVIESPFYSFGAKVSLRRIGKEKYGAAIWLAIKVFPFLFICGF
ncbi:hypothetical protein ALP82_200261 [Pseudomonas savastanoi pv. fraxini]|nr:hypothetical protein ALP82_200261 [Pseudomonas savastanoi pv. fraxini]